MLSAENDTDPFEQDEAYWRGYEDGWGNAVRRMQELGYVPTTRVIPSEGNDDV